MYVLCESEMNKHIAEPTNMHILHKKIKCLKSEAIKNVNRNENQSLKLSNVGTFWIPGVISQNTIISLESF